VLKLISRPTQNLSNADRSTTASDEWARSCPAT
jgi:hypothetical protein